jgi:WD40 repeat protein
VTHALISPDGRRVFTLGQPGETNFASSLRDFEADASEVRIWDAATGRLVRPPFNYKKRISSLALSSNGQWLGANLGKSVLVWNLRQPRAIQFSRGKQDKTNYLAGLKPERANTEIETLLPEIPRPSRADDNNRWIACLAFSPDSGRIVTACTDGSVRICGLFCSERRASSSLER